MMFNGIFQSEEFELLFDFIELIKDEEKLQHICFILLLYMNVYLSSHDITFLLMLNGKHIVDEEIINKLKKYISVVINKNENNSINLIVEKLKNYSVPNECGWFYIKNYEKLFFYPIDEVRDDNYLWSHI